MQEFTSCSSSHVVLRPVRDDYSGSSTHRALRGLHVEASDTLDVAMRLVVCDFGGDQYCLSYIKARNYKFCAALAVYIVPSRN